MAKRRDWNALSSAYRSRLVRSGIDKEAYEAGTSLKAARGHAETPEHPREAIKNPSRFALYRKRRGGLQAQVWEKKKRIFEGNFKWHEGRAREYIYVGMADDEGRKIRPSMASMREFMALPDHVVERRASEAGYGFEDDWRWLFYH